MSLITALTAGGVVAGVAIATRRQRPQWLTVLSNQSEQPSGWRATLSQLRERWSYSTRRTQMETLAQSRDNVDITTVEHRLNLELFFAGASLGITIIGSLFYPPLRLLSLPSIIYSIVPIYRDAFRSARAGNIGVDVLYVFTQTLVVVRGFLLPANLGAFYYFLSRKLLVMAEDRFRVYLHEIFGQLPTTVHQVLDGVEIASTLDEISTGDCIAVRAGEIIPVDGIVVAGQATVDQQRLTGEAQPAEIGVEETVYASTVVLAGWLHIEVVEAGATTIVARIGAILDQTTAVTADRKLWAERLGDRTVLPLVALGGVSVPLIGLDGAQAIIDSHPQRRMNISSALCTLNYLGLAAEQNILIKDGRALELLQQIDMVVFDKTGTLTLDEPHVARILPAEGYCTETILRYAAAAEVRQDHPIAKAILLAAADQGVAFPTLDEAHYHAGYGLTVEIEGRKVYVGSTRFLQQEGITISTAMQQKIDAIWQQGDSVVLVAVDGELAGLIELNATLRPEAAAIVQTIHNLKLATVIISGDHEAPTQRLAKALGIDQYFANVLPEEKARLVTRLQEEGRTVCFVGDGINDTIAMKQGDVAISLRGATTAATDTAHIVLMDADLQQLPTLLSLGERYTQNLQATAGTLLSGTALGLSGAYFLGFGLWHVTTTNMIFFPASLGAAMWPRLRHPTL